MLLGDVNCLNSRLESEFVVAESARVADSREGRRRVRGGDGVLLKFQDGGFGLGQILFLFVNGFFVVAGLRCGLGDVGFSAQFGQDIQHTLDYLQREFFSGIVKGHHDLLVRSVGGHRDPREHFGDRQSCLLRNIFLGGMALDNPLDDRKRIGIGTQDRRGGRQ